MDEQEGRKGGRRIGDRPSLSHSVTHSVTHSLTYCYGFSRSRCQNCSAQESIFPVS